MNILFENIREYIKERKLSFTHYTFDVNGYGNYDRIIYNVTKNKEIYTPERIKSLIDNDKIFVYENIKDDYGNLLGSEKINDKHIVSLEAFNVQFPKEFNTINYYKGEHPNIKIPLEGKLNCTALCKNQFIKNANIEGRDNGVLTNINCNIYLTNVSYDMFSEFGHDYRHVTFNEDTQEFTAYGIKYEELQKKILDIKENGLREPIMFELYQKNLYPVYGRLEWFAALYLKLPIIPIAIIFSDIKFTCDTFYPETKISIDRLNMMLEPYIKINKDDEEPTGYIGTVC